MNNPIEQVKREIPSVDEIINATWRKLNFKKEFVRKKFGEAIVKFDEEATKEFKEHEKKPLRKLAEIWINSQQKQIREKLKIAIERESQEEFINKLSEIFWEFGLLVQRLEKDLGNMRKAR